MFTNASVLINNIFITHSTNTEIIYVFVTMLIMSFKREWYLLLFILFCLRFNIIFFCIYAFVRWFIQIDLEHILSVLCIPQELAPWSSVGASLSEQLCTNFTFRCTTAWRLFTPKLCILVPCSSDVYPSGNNMYSCGTTFRGREGKKVLFWGYCPTEKLLYP